MTRMNDCIIIAYNIYFVDSIYDCFTLLDVSIKCIVIYRYIPTRLWGFSGHVQTIIHSIIGRVRCPWPIGERVNLLLSDGSTLTFDVYQPLDTSHEGMYKSCLAWKTLLAPRLNPI